MSLFKRGYAEVEREERRREEDRKNRGEIFRFILKEGEAEINFLTEEPINYYEHSLPTRRNGKEFFEAIPCSGSSCPHCADGNRPTFKSAFLIIDRRPYTYKNKDNKEVTKESSLKLYVVGTKVAGVLQRKSKRVGLVNNRYLIERIGKDTNTTYTFDNIEGGKATEKEILDLLPNEELKNMYDGTMDSLYDIIEKEIMKLLANNSENDVEDEDNSFDEDLVTSEYYTKPKEEKPLVKKKIGVKKLKLK